MAKTSINYLFPPQKVHELPTWRFVLHFMAPRFFAGRAVRRATASLANLEFKALFIAAPITFDSKSRTLDVPVEVSAERRQQSDSLEAYESDIWRIYGTLVGLGFGDLFYEALDWHEPSPAGPDQQ